MPPTFSEICIRVCGGSSILSCERRTILLHRRKKTIGTEERICIPKTSRSRVISRSNPPTPKHEPNRKRSLTRLGKSIVLRPASIQGPQIGPTREQALAANNLARARAKDTREEAGYAAGTYTRARILACATANCTANN